ncbi:MAG: alpha-amylase family glycosyl hydrolase [Synergistaceae bacterium]|jgi:maltose alpha-D-glucosyltransferase/alpha-amylase|nr:alpha-amylase family glycosyl hydrolase [Synergistaceae bacterium]
MNIKSLTFFLLCFVTTQSVTAQNPSQPSWLSDAIVYQIYPSSFQDSDGNGIGDIPGIISRLEYIKSIGVTTIWINPIFVSGWKDGGYDVIDFYKVDPRFGTNSDLVELVNKAHVLDLKVILDLVAGHSSDQNKWFLQSREADPHLRYSDYYIWPTFKPEVEKSSSLEGKQDYAQLMNSFNNIVNKFVKSDAPRGPYYIKNFFDSQPALNFGFANPDPNHPWEQAVDAPGPMSMRREIKNIMQFWMDKGVDGFRVDMAASLVKNDFDKSATIKLWKDDLAKWFKENYPENLLIAEWFNPAQSIESGFNIDFFCHDGMYNYSTLFFYGRGDRYGTPAVDPYFDMAGEGGLKTWYDLYTYQYEAVKGKGYVSMPSGNHDFNRLSTGVRSTPDQLKVAMTFFFTMPGVPFIFYGDEIGLKQNPDAKPVEGSFGRAGARIPMLWNSSENAGFSTASTDKLYIAQDPDPDRMTVEKSEADPNSLLNYVRALIKLREEYKMIGADADWKLLNTFEKPYPMVYERTQNDKKCIVVLNPSDKEFTTEIPNQGVTPEVIGGSYKKATYKPGKSVDKITISPVSAIIYHLYFFSNK